MKPKTYKILVEAVETGTRIGYNRTHKYTDNPSEEEMIRVISDNVINEICEWFSFSEEEIL